MKLSITENKNRLIATIKDYFDSEFIDKISRETKFVQRTSKLQGMIFFSMRIYSEARGCNKFGGFM